MTAPTSPPRIRPNGLRHALQEHTRATYQEAILDAAERVFIRDGIQLAKMVDIAEETGVSVGTLYNYFESKESVFAALVERHRERYFSMLEEPLDTDDPIVGLVTVVKRSMHFVAENGVLFTIYLKSSYPSLEGVPRCMPTIHPEQDNARYCQRLAFWLKRGTQIGKIRTDVPIDELVWALHASLHMLMVEWLHSPSGFSITDRAQRLVDLFLEGASSK
jgi:AcrR family transcriptional regulator